MLRPLPDLLLGLLNVLVQFAHRSPQIVHTRVGLSEADGAVVTPILQIRI